LFDALIRRGYQIVGPTVRDRAIVYEQLNSVDDLPVGWADEQDGGSYRLKKRDDEALFGFTVGPHSWKQFLHPPKQRLWRAERQGKSFDIIQEDDKPPKYAFIGVRSCDLHAIAVQDRVLLRDQYADPIYRARREDCFIVAVNCGQAGGTCFCVSMNTGPKATFGFDLAMTEALEGERHYFVVEVGTEKGAEAINEITHCEAGDGEQARAEQIVARTATQMGRAMETAEIKELPQGSPSWREGSGLWPYFLATGGTIGFRSSSSLSWNRHLRVVHCWRLASPGPETGGPLQHPVAQTAEAGIVSTGFDRPVRPPSTEEDQAANRAAISSCRGKTRARVAREGRRDRQDRARAQRVLA